MNHLKSFFNYILYKLRDMYREHNDSFVKGLKHGVTLYSWWGDDGKQYVGKGEKTLKKALEDIDNEYEKWKGKIYDK